jgi:hypothetical protein
MSAEEFLDDILDDLKMLSKHDPDRDGCMVPEYHGSWIRASYIDDIIEKIEKFQKRRNK